MQKEQVKAVISCHDSEYIIIKGSWTLHLDFTMNNKAGGQLSQIDVHFSTGGEQRDWIILFIGVKRKKWKPYLTQTTSKMKLSVFFSPFHPPHQSVIHLSHTPEGTLSPRPWVKKKKTKGRKEETLKASIFPGRNCFSNIKESESCHRGHLGYLSQIT